MWEVIIAGGALLWWGNVLVLALLGRGLPRLSDEATSSPEEWPKLSVVVAACNEGDTIASALQKLLQQDYPNFEIIVVNDRSTDQTETIVAELAQSDSRIHLITVTELPEGWLGKVHALHKGFERADGEWVVFADADVHFDVGLFKKAISVVIQDRLVHLSVLPDLSSSSFAASCVVACALRGIAVSTKPWSANDPDNDSAIGGGAFNLVRRDFWAKTEGFEWLRMEVADDIALALQVSNHGGRSRFFLALDMIKVPWYPTYSDAVRGLEKNAFAQVARFTLWRGLLLAALLGCGVSVPFVACLILPMSQALWVVGACMGAAIASAAIGRQYHISRFDHMLCSFVFGELLLIWIVIRGTILGAIRGGVIWRGTVYPSEVLRKGVRVDF